MKLNGGELKNLLTKLSRHLRALLEYRGQSFFFFFLRIVQNKIEQYNIASGKAQQMDVLERQTSIFHPYSYVLMIKVYWPFFFFSPKNTFKLN